MEYKKEMFKLSSFSNTTNIEKSSQFIELLKSRWDILHQKTGVFRYKIDNLQERLVDEKYLLHLNPGRSNNRRIPEDIDHICQPFNESKFNFTKVSPDEILFNLVDENDDSNFHTLIVNVSPISRYHTLLCPNINKELPQVATEDSLKLALEIMFVTSDRSVRLGFNSLCAMASVNHLHYHLFLESHILPVETVKCQNVKGPLYQTTNYPATAFCFEVTTRKSIGEKSREVYKLIEYFLKKSIAHNIFITRGNGFSDVMEVVRILIWPRKSSAGVKLLKTFNVAICEFSGWFPVFNADDFVNLQTQDLEKEIIKWNYDTFKELYIEVQSLY